MRLIDADALSEKLCETTIFIKDGEVFQRMINDAPTVSAEAEQVTGKLKKPCNSLLKADSDECKEQKSKLDLISRQDAIKTVIRMCAPICDWELEKKAYTDCVIDEINSLPSAEPPVLTCDGCRHAGTYDTDFPCSGCIRREKDYYEQER